MITKECQRFCHCALVLFVQKFYFKTQFEQEEHFTLAIAVSYLSCRRHGMKRGAE